MISEDIYAALATHAGLLALVPAARITPRIRRQGSALPAVVFRVVEEQPVRSMEGPAGLSIVRVQLHCYAASYSGMKALQQQARLALQETAEPGLAVLACSEGSDLFEPEMGEHSCTVTVSLSWRDWPATRYDGASYATRGPLVGMTDSKTFTFSAWVKFNADTGASQLIWASTTTSTIHLRVWRYDPAWGEAEWRKALSCQWHDEAGVFKFDIRSTIPLELGIWYHVAVAADIVGGVGQMYVDGADVGSLRRVTDSTFTLSTHNWTIGARVYDETRYLQGDLGPLWWSTELLDLSVAANIAKFRTSASRPANVGPRGELVTGTVPAMFLRKGDPRNNSGAGGNFSAVGALAASPDGP